ncbi:MAG: hypothetical protein ABI130_03405 [Leifsonia sp.]
MQSPILDSPGAFQPKRLTVSLTARDRADLELIRNSPEWREVLPDHPSDPSDAALVHSLFEFGVRAVRASAEERGYAALAEDSEYLEYRSVRRTAAGRRRADNVGEA